MSTRKGTEGRTPQKNIGASESGIDKAIKKTKEAFSGDNDAVDYDEVKHNDDAQPSTDDNRTAPHEESGDRSTDK